MALNLPCFASIHQLLHRSRTIFKKLLYPKINLKLQGLICFARTPLHVFKRVISFVFARRTAFNWCLVGDEQWGRQSVSLQGEQEDGEAPQMVQLTHVPFYPTVRERLWDGFLPLLTLGHDGEPEALRWWRELTLMKFEPSCSSIFTYKFISIVSGWISFLMVASMMLIAGLHHPSSSLYLEISYATSPALLH